MSEEPGWLLSPERAIDLIVLLTVVEAAVLAWLWRAKGRGIAPGRLLPTLAAGLFLLLACRAILIEAHPGVVALALAGAGAAHLLDIRGRWR
ncbi:MAG: hypothetical protein RIB45_02905 [Marivibrio sp.]|uniref:hypothetical protein n=1 Tax=Marivibrio sp. TaxID=2039719 RepID=UPI0032EBFE38